MIIEVLFDTVVDLKFFFGVLPLSLKEEIGREKMSIWREMSSAPLSASGRFLERAVWAEGNIFLITTSPGESYFAEDGARVQQVLILTIQGRKRATP